MIVTDAARRAHRRVDARRRLRLGVRRVGMSWWGIGQSAVAAAVAWEFAVRVLHHAAPFFACVAAIVCLSGAAFNRARRVVELALGVTVGVGVADLLVHLIGKGGWQIGLVVVLAMTLALLLDGGMMIVNQAALQAVFVTVLPAPPGGYFSRWVDALTGGLVALLVAVALPADPRRDLRRHADALLLTMAGALRESARAARSGDPDTAMRALERARATQPALDQWRDAIRAGEETSRLSPLRRTARGEVASHRHALPLVDRAVRNLRVALRRVVAAVEDSTAGIARGRLPEVLAAVLDDLAGAFYTLPGTLRDPDGEGARRAVAALTALAGRLDPERLSADSLSATVVVAQLRSAVIDLLQVPGISAADARATLPR